MPPRNPKPAPVVVETRCSLCDLPWEDHGDEPTTGDCIRLLKAELTRRPIPTIIYRDRWPYQQPYWYTVNDNTWSSGAIDVNSSSATVTYLTPRDEEPPDPVGAVA